MLDPENERWVSMQEICEHLGVKRHAVIKWIETRGMPATKIGKLWKFKISKVEEWIASGKASE